MFLSQCVTLAALAMLQTEILTWPGVSGATFT